MKDRSVRCEVGERPGRADRPVLEHPLRLLAPVPVQKRHGVTAKALGKPTADLGLLFLRGDTAQDIPFDQRRRAGRDHVRRTAELCRQLQDRLRQIPRRIEVADQGRHLRGQDQPRTLHGLQAERPSPGEGH